MKCGRRGAAARQSTALSSTNQLHVLTLGSLCPSCYYLFISEHEQTGLAELLVREHPVQLLSADGQTLAVRRVYHHYYKLEK